MNGVWGFNAWMSLNRVGGSAKSPAAAIERRENVVPAGLFRPARSNGLSATHRANVKRQSWLSPKRRALGFIIAIERKTSAETDIGTETAITSASCTPF